MIYLKEKFSSEIIQDVVKSIKDSGITYWLDHGTLLGIIRDQKLIDWDADVDIGAWHIDERKIISLKCDLSKKYQYVSYNRLTNAISVRLFDSAQAIHWSIDIVFYHKAQGRAVKYYPNTELFMGKVAGKFLTVISGDLAPVSQKKWVNNTLNIINKIYPLVPKWIVNGSAKILEKYAPKLLNTVDDTFFYPIISHKTIYGELNIPDNAMKYLDVRYGSDWMTPKKNWNHLLDDGGIKQGKA